MVGVGSTNRTRKEKTHESAWVRNRLGSGHPGGGRDRGRGRVQRWGVLSSNERGGGGGARRLFAPPWFRVWVLLDLSAPVLPLHLFLPFCAAGGRLRGGAGG